MSKNKLLGKTALSITALGVVFGDIGTSPLYAFRECFLGVEGVPITHANVMGVLSLIFWSLFIVITLKYVFFIMKADEQGEGGVFALLAILRNVINKNSNSKLFKSLPYMALCSAAFLYSDGVLTPAVSVLSALEGIKEVVPESEHIIMPLTCVILFVLFFVQRFGTGKIGKIFGPVLIIWFFSIAVVGVLNIKDYPSIVYSINPYYAISYFVNNGFKSILILSSVVLCITGGEALYADLGHFGRDPIRNSWILVVCPSLILNYFGQGALMLQHGKDITNPFYQSVPELFTIPMLILATFATIIASQALISGVFSLTRQAIQLGFLPRMNIVYTSSKAKGQVYVPIINNLFMVGCIALVLIFKNSSNLAVAYGLAVTGSMGITSLLFFFVVKYVWKWSFSKSFGLFLVFFIVDIAFLGANVVKVLHNGWVPLVSSIIIMWIMTTWKKGRMHLAENFEKISLPLKDFLNSAKELPLQKTSGTGVFMSINQNFTPVSLAKMTALVHAYPERIVLITIRTANAAFVSIEKRLSVQEINKEFNIYGIKAQYGYMERPDLAEIVELSQNTDVKLAINECTFYVGREILIHSKDERIMHPLRKSLFIFLSKNSRTAQDYYNIPYNRLLEIGTVVSI